jgi:hypothetical protein
MKLAALLAMGLGLGLLAGTAVAQVPTLPTTTTLPKLPTSTTVPKLPTTTVPRITTNVPKVTTTVPKVTTMVPKLPTTTTAPKTPTPTISTPSAPKVPGTTTRTATTASMATSTVQKTLLSGPSTSGRSGPAQFSAPGATSASPRPTSGAVDGGNGSGSASGGAASGPSVKHFDSSRTWIATDGRKKRVTTLTFFLAQRAKVIFTVKQLTPSCHTVGRFIVQGKRGANKVRFAGRLKGEMLDPGTYRITARLRNGRAVERVLLVIVKSGAPSPVEIAALRASNVCPTLTGFAATAANSTGASNTGDVSELGHDGSNSDNDESEGGFPSASPPSDDDTGVLGSATVKEAAKALQPGLIALLIAAIILLGLASMPGTAVVGGRTNEALARHRPQIMALGTAALLAVALTFLLG